RPQIKLLLTERPKPAPSPPGRPIDIQANPQPAGLRSWSQPVDELPERVLETPPRPLPQVMFTKNGTAADALAPPLGAAQVAPPPRRLVDVDVCQGYYDVMGQFDSAFNCSKDTYIYCCGSCHFRFCCPERGQQLEQHLCKNYDSPDWAKTPAIDISSVVDPMGTIDPLRMQSHNTGFVIGGVVVFMVAVAVGIKVVFNKVQQEANHRDLNMPRALVDMLRHQSSPVQQDERNNSMALTVADGQGGGTLGRPPKNHYAPGGLGDEMMLDTFYNTELPPSYESATKPELNRYSSLKKVWMSTPLVTAPPSADLILHSPPCSPPSTTSTGAGTTPSVAGEPSRGTPPAPGSPPPACLPRPPPTRTPSTRRSPSTTPTTTPSPSPRGRSSPRTSCSTWATCPGTQAPCRASPRTNSTSTTKPWPPLLPTKTQTPRPSRVRPRRGRRGRRDRSGRRDRTDRRGC
uniref:Shisa family member 7a n=1 Tax=Gadus morhua TaxID=8049 RepID=A0A8C5AJT2_GADMO